MAEWFYGICQEVHSVSCLSPYQIQAWVQILVLSFAQAGGFTSLCLSYLICRMGTIAVSASQE